MKKVILKAITFILDMLGLIISIPAMVFIWVGMLLNDWSDSIKHI